MELNWYQCARCGNVVELVEDHGVPVCCCGEPMRRLRAGESDGAQEKHVPIVTAEDGRVRVSVGEAAHPMGEEHHIACIVLVTDKGVFRRELPHTGAPEAVFALTDGETPEAAYEYCNLHGLWMTKL